MNIIRCMTALGALVFPFNLGAMEMPSDDDLERARREQKIAEAHKARAQAELAEENARREQMESAFPSAASKGLDGKITAKNIAIQSTILAYETMNDVADSMAAKVCLLNPERIVFYNPADATAIAAYNGVMVEIDQLIATCNELSFPDKSPPTPRHAMMLPGAGIGAGVRGSVGFVADLIRMFRTDTSIEGVSVDMHDDALKAAVAGCLTSRGIKVYDPHSFPINAMIYRNPSALLLKFDNLKKARDKMKLGNPDKDKLKEVDSSVAHFIKQLEELNAKSGMSPLMFLLQTENLTAALGSGGYMLRVGVLATGGNNKISHNIFTGSRLSYNGGVVASYTVYGTEGDILASGVLFKDHDYVKAGDIGDNLSGGSSKNK